MVSTNRNPGIPNLITSGIAEGDTKGEREGERDTEKGRDSQPKNKGSERETELD